MSGGGGIGIWKPERMGSIVKEVAGEAVGTVSITVMFV